VSAGCARCGSCCSPVPFTREQHESVSAWSTAALERVPDPGTDLGWAHWLASGWGEEARDTAVGRYDPAGRWRRDADFIAARWTPDGDGGCKCDAFDPATASCTARDSRPPVCRDYPWYGKEPSADQVDWVNPQCSYLADLPSDKRPEGSRPLIPVTVI
jgi:Putative zinc- or iron-chelating domain